MNLKEFNTNAKFIEVLGYVKKYRNFSFDFETAGFNDLSPILISFVIRDKNGQNYGFVVDFREDKDLDTLFTIFDESDLVICHNSSFDLKVLYYLGYDIYTLIPKLYDTMLALYVLNTEQKKGLKNFIEEFEKATTYGDVSDIVKFDLNKFKEYNLKDAYYTYKLYDKTYKEIKEKFSSMALFLETNISILSIYMMTLGIYIDMDYLEYLIDSKYNGEIDRVEENLKTVAKEVFKFELDLNSRKSLVEFFQNYLFKNTKLDESFFTEKGSLSITTENLEYYLENYSNGINDKIYQFLKDYIYYKELRKIVETYSKETFSINELFGRIYPQINSSGTRTARMTITNPPLQTIPANELGRLIRRAFCSKEENNFLVIDLSQLELRILVHYINIYDLIDKYNKGIDLHTQTSELLGIGRKEAKVVNFMIVYGGGPSALSRKLGISVEEATKHIQNFVKGIEGYNSLKQHISRFSTTNKYMRLPFGYYRYLDGDNNTIERVAFNTLIQTTASIYVKFGMYMLFHIFKDTSGLLLQIHDELLFENSKENLEIIFLFLKKIYEQMFVYFKDNGKNMVEKEKNSLIIGQALKFKIEGHIGTDWLSCK